MSKILSIFLEALTVYKQNKNKIINHPCFSFKFSSDLFYVTLRQNFGFTEYGLLFHLGVHGLGDKMPIPSWLFSETWLFSASLNSLVFEKTLYYSCKTANAGEWVNWLMPTKCSPEKMLLHGVLTPAMGVETRASQFLGETAPWI